MSRAYGSVSTSATTEAAINGTAYTEPTVGAQRGLKSSSANDAAAGTGARKVKITYYKLASDGTITGPFYETVTLNGVTAVPTVATDIALIERLDVITVGSGGVAAGTITLTIDSGAGAAVTTIAAGKNATEFAHHYVPSGKRCKVTDLVVSGGDAAQAFVELRAQAYPTANIPEVRVGAKVGGALTTPRVPLALDERTVHAVVGPARLQGYVVAANANAQVTTLDFGFYEL